MRIWASYAILPTYVKGLNVTVRATGTIGTGFGIPRGDAARYETTEGDVGSRIWPSARRGRWFESTHPDHFL